MIFTALPTLRLRADMRSWSRPVLAVLVLAGLVAAAPVKPAYAAIGSPEFETCLLEKINDARVSAGVDPLIMASDIGAGVRGWSEWMSNNEFRHTTTAERSAILPGGTFTSGENIAWRRDWAQHDCTEIHTMLMTSTGHRANILRSSWRFVGLGAHYAGNNEWWVTEMFFDANGYTLEQPLVESGTRPCGSGMCDSLGVVDTVGEWGLLSALSADASIDEFFFGDPGDVAFMGDWDGDGTATPGLYRRSDGFVYLRYSNTEGIADTTFFFGNPGDYPLVGDFNGDGRDTVSIYRSSEARIYVINQLGVDGGGLGAADYSFLFGNQGDTPFVGDFNGDGVDTVGLHRASSGLVYFRDSLTEGTADWSFIYGNPGDVILAADWDGDGDDTVAVYRPSTGRVYVNLENTSGAADYTLYVGTYPIATNWGR